MLNRMRHPVEFRVRKQPACQFDFHLVASRASKWAGITADAACHWERPFATDAERESGRPICQVSWFASPFDRPRFLARRTLPTDNRPRQKKHVSAKVAIPEHEIGVGLRPNLFGTDMIGVSRACLIRRGDPLCVHSLLARYSGEPDCSNHCKPAKVLSDLGS